MRHCDKAGTWSAGTITARPGTGRRATTSLRWSPLRVSRAGRRDSGPIKGCPNCASCRTARMPSCRSRRDPSISTRRDRPRRGSCSSTPSATSPATGPTGSGNPTSSVCTVTTGRSSRSSSSGRRSSSGRATARSARSRRRRAPSDSPRWKPRASSILARCGAGWGSRLTSRSWSCCPTATASVRRRSGPRTEVSNGAVGRWPAASCGSSGATLTWSRRCALSLLGTAPTSS